MQDFFVDSNDFKEIVFDFDEFNKGYVTFSAVYEKIDRTIYVNVSQDDIGNHFETTKSFDLCKEYIDDYIIRTHLDEKVFINFN